MGETIYRGWVSEYIFQGAQLNSGSTSSIIKLNTPSNSIVWDNNNAPDGWIPNNLTAKIPGGYAVKTESYLIVSGHWYSTLVDGPNVLGLQVWQYGDTKNTVMQAIPVNKVYSAANQDFNYGLPPDVSPIPPDYLNSQNPGQGPVPISSSISLPGYISFYTIGSGTGKWYSIYNLTVRLITRITATRDCNSNISSPICRDICIANPTSTACYTVYKDFCLTGPPENLATDICYNYYQAYIKINGSNTADIDPQRIRFCKKYKGLEDFLEKAPKGSKEWDICACMVSDPNRSDPNATIQYDNYFQSVVAQYPGFNKLGLKSKCVFSDCASSSFGYGGLPVSGCNVPLCIQLTTVNNDGTINGDVVINQEANCGSYTNPAGDTWIWWVIIFVVLIFLIIMAIYFVFTYRRKRSDGSKEK